MGPFTATVTRDHRPVPLPRSDGCGKPSFRAAAWWRD